MSAPTARRLVTAGSLSLALALAAPAAAFAGTGDEPGDQGKGQGRPSPAASSTASPAPASSSSQGSSSSAGRSGASSTSKGGAQSGSKEGSTTPAKRAGGSDPRGNNGTVKIDDVPFDDTPGNEPHVGCLFQIDFFGFDKDDVADVTLTGQAPTGGGLLWSRENAPISDDAAGGGQDVDASITVAFADLDLSDATAHPKQGYHVKLAADVESAPGGAKQKVFWITCDAPAAVGGTTGAPATGGGTVTTQAVDRAPLAPTFGEGSTSVTSSGVAGTALRGTTTGAAQGAGAATVSARSASRPSALPFTGVQGLGYLLALGASAVGVGTLAHRLGRRRHEADVPVA